MDKKYKESLKSVPAKNNSSITIFLFRYFSSLLFYLCVSFTRNKIFEWIPLLPSYVSFHHTKVTIIITLSLRLSYPGKIVWSRNKPLSSLHLLDCLTSKIVEKQESLFDRRNKERRNRGNEKIRVQFYLFSRLAIFWPLQTSQPASSSPSLSSSSLSPLIQFLPSDQASSAKKDLIHPISVKP